jgi:hypothetical protein
MSEPFILPECYADTELVLALGYDSAAVIHKSGKPEVCNAMRPKREDEEHKKFVGDFVGKKALGVVDEDKKANQNAYFKKATVIEEIESMKLQKLSGEKHHLIVICPAHEAWILNAARLAGIQPAIYGLPNEPKKLKVFSRNPDEKYKSFLRDVVQANPEPVKTLKSWIEQIEKL